MQDENPLIAYLGQFVHSGFNPAAATSRLILSIVVLIATMLSYGCGSPRATNQQASIPPPTSLPPAVPASEPVLLYIGAGTSAPDVTAVEAVLAGLALGYTTTDANGLNALTEPELAGYKLVIVPGGNSITIGQALTAETASAIRGAVQDYGTHYLGLCAGAFFGGYSIYNGVNLTAGVSFNFYADENKGIQEEAVEISFPNSPSLDMYWQDGPQLSGWGSVVGKFPDGTPAIVEGSSGSGFVIFTGVHPEAPASWWEGISSTTPLSQDLTYAATLVQAALNGTTLPHF